MSEKRITPGSVQELRVRCAVNACKERVLGAKHIRQAHQTQAMINALPTTLQGSSLFDKTWSKWFSKDHPVLPQEAGLKVLDEIEKWRSDPRTLNEKHVDTTTEAKDDETLNGEFSALVRGGLMTKLLQPTKSADPWLTIIGRANRYVPSTALHLHFDALEAAGWHDDRHTLPWHWIASAAATRVLRILFQRWNPRRGEVYASFASDFSIAWEAADSNERQKIRAACAQCRPDQFEIRMKVKASPDWSRMSIKSDISSDHIYKLLFSLAADPEFLVEDRFEAWVFDLATAALAMGAVAWVDRYKTMTRETTEEIIYWAAFRDIFFSRETFEADGHYVKLAMRQSGANWHESSMSLFLKAREAYQQALIRFGLSFEEILTVVKGGQDFHPIQYIGG